ncbi:decapping and exoribonuclease protein-like isoform X4 [Periplaneta americana]
MLLCTPFEQQEGWIILASKHGGTIFLCAKETEEKHQQRELMTDRQRQFMSWGYKFEQYMTSDKPGREPDSSQPVNEREELCVMFRTKLNSHRLLFGAEMDGVNSKTAINSCAELAQAEFIELKTSRQIETRRQDDNFRRFKLIKWWGQSFLVGIKEVICGFRDDRGIVHRLEPFEVSKLPKMAVNFWNPNVCMNFCDHFLSFVKSVVVEEDWQTVWKFEWKPHEDVIATKIVGPSEFTFLPAWFTSP